MDWSAILSQAIETGGLAAIIIVLVTLTEKKGAAMLANAQALAESYKQLATEYREREAETQRLYKEKDAEAIAKDRVISDLRHSLDDSHTECAVSKLMYCRKAKCIERDPPFGSNSDVVVEESRKQSRKEYQK